MRDYIIMTDSCCDLNQQEVDELGLTVLPLSFTINGKTYSERHIGHYGSSECVEGNFEEDDEIPESIYDALNDFFCFGCQQALAQFEIEEGIEEE